METNIWAQHKTLKITRYSLCRRLALTSYLLIISKPFISANLQAIAQTWLENCISGYSADRIHGRTGALCCQTSPQKEPHQNHLLFVVFGFSNDGEMSWTFLDMFQRRNRARRRKSVLCVLRMPAIRSRLCRNLDGLTCSKPRVQCYIFCS